MSKERCYFCGDKVVSGYINDGRRRYPVCQGCLDHMDAGRTVFERGRFFLTGRFFVTTPEDAKSLFGRDETHYSVSSSVYQTLV